MLVQLKYGVGREFCLKDRVFILFCKSLSIQFRQYWYTISSLLVYDFIITGIQFRQHWYTILPIPVYYFVNTSESTFSKILSGLRTKSKILKTFCFTSVQFHSRQNDIKYLKMPNQL